MFILSTVPIQAEETTSPSVNITTHWLQSGSGANDHAYLLTFSDNGTYGLNIDMLHLRDQVALETNHQLEWGEEDGMRTALLTFNTSLQWSDTIDLGVDITSHNTLPISVSTERSMLVGVWNQPMEDHEVLLSTTWSMDQNYTTDEGEQRFSLVFDGQGWQQRTGDVLNSWELGNGTFHQASFMVKRGDHGYFEGEQHISKEPARPSPCDTFVSFWQSPCAKKEFPTSAAALERIKQGFYASRPSGTAKRRKCIKQRSAKHRKKRHGGGVYQTW